VTTLPGYNGQLPSTHYSGYIPVGKLSGTSGNLHYWVIEAEKEAATAPVVLWLNGGPGSSSLIGLLTENGQIMTNDDSLTQKINGVPQVFYNKYSWSGLANMVYLESPKGVGFSYCDDAKKSSDCVNTDESTAQDAYEFLVNFFAAYPEYKSNEFYITGESYAGIYIPMLIDQIDQDSLGAKINFVGAAIGNGCWGNTVGTCAFSSPEAAKYKADFFFGHGMYSQALRSEIDDTCGDFNRLPPKCVESISEMMTQIGTYNVYNIYDTCGNDQRRRLEEVKSFTQLNAEMSVNTVTVETAQSFRVSAGYSAALNDYECGAETAMDAYLADPSVIAALHVQADTVGMQYTKTATDLLPLYKDLVNRHPDNILIYSGDTDGCVPYVGTEEWTRNLGFNVTKDWHQWFAKPDDVHGMHKAGYAVNFNSFQFVTINGAGHMVPQVSALCLLC
jgi:serine carboxypeptidase-like clade 1